MNALGLLEYNPASHGIWIVAAIAFGVIGLAWLLDLVDDVRGWFVRRVLRRGAASGEEEEGEAAPPPVIRSLHRDPQPIRGGTLTRYTTENRVNPIEPSASAGRSPS